MDKTTKAEITEDRKVDSEEHRAKLIGYKWDFLKFFLGTFIIGIAGVVSTWIFKEYELKIANRKAESEYLQPYLAQYLILLDKDSIMKYDKAYRMAEFITYTLTDKDSKKNWGNLGNMLLYKLDSVKHIYQSIKESQSTESSIRDSLIALKDSLIAMKNTSAKVIAKIGKVQRQVEESETKISESEAQVKVLKQHVTNSSLITINIDDAKKFEQLGFEALLNKDVNLAIEMFSKSENAYNGYHEVYGIKRYLEQNKQLLSLEKQNDWKSAYQKILSQFEWEMPEDYKRKLQEQSK